MKKVALSLAGVLAAAAFAPEASALPVFARQTGMACNACHFQHFPLLNSFGRSFKSSGFTLMGAQGKVEGDMLSIPAEVNAAVLTSMGYTHSNATQGPGLLTHYSASGAPIGGFYVGAEQGEASLFLGGRGSDFMGFLGEVTLGNGAGAMDSLKTPILFDVSGSRAGIVFFTTNGQGASYGFETLNTGANAIHSITNTVGFNGEYINAVSAQQYIGTGSRATGAAIVGNNDMGFINVTKFVGVGPDVGGAFAALSSTYLRAAYTTDLGGWDSAIGVQDWSGTSLQATGPTLLGVVGNQETKAWAIDGQVQGALGNMPTGFYFSYASAAKSDASGTNFFNNSTQFARSSLNIDAEVGVIPEKVTVGGALRFGKSGQVDNSGDNGKDNALYLTVTYKLAQNELLRLSYVTQSGSFWDTTTATGTNGTDIGKSSYTLNLYALF